ncbi:MAG: CocE/NonD family hydrolase, partial [Chroococcales cyanobacterium]
MLDVKKSHAFMMTRNGVRLDADIYTPMTKGEFPVLLMRQPYGRAIASTVVYAHPRWYAAQGYIVVIQDVRGRGTSEGEFELFANEIEDGFDTVQWASQLPQSNGKVGMYGFSYQGMTQLYAAISHPPALKTICPSMIGYDLYTDWAYENGAFCLQGNLSWAIQIAAETARLKGDETAYCQLYAASRNLPLYDSIPALPNILKEFAPNSFYHDWLNNPHPNSYWENLSPKSRMQDVDLPMLHIGGWFDPYLRGTLNLYHEMSDRSSFPQHLIIGVWQHIPWGRKVGAVDYGVNAATPVDEFQLRWFDYFLKDIDTEILDNPPVYAFEMGSNQWHYFNTFPNSHSVPKSKNLESHQKEISRLVFENNQTVYFLLSSGLASLREDSGELIQASEIQEP